MRKLFRTRIRGLYFRFVIICMGVRVCVRMISRTKRTVKCFQAWHFLCFVELSLKLKMESFSLIKFETIKPNNWLVCFHSLHEVPCRYDGYQREIQRNAAPQRCGTLIFDDMIEKKSMLKLQEMAQRYCTALGDTNFHNRESYNLRWINLHHLFKYGPQEKMFDEQDFELIRNTSEAVKVSRSRRATFKAISSRLVSNKSIDWLVSFRTHLPIPSTLSAPHSDCHQSAPSSVLSLNLLVTSRSFLTRNSVMWTKFVRPICSSPPFFGCRPSTWTLQVDVRNSWPVDLSRSLRCWSNRNSVDSPPGQVDGKIRTV